MENSIVYITTNLVNGKKYIGSHNGNNKYYKGSGTYLAKAIKKYGGENFKRQILWEGDIQYMKEMEEYYIDYYNAHISPLFYNATPKCSGKVAFRTKEEHKQIKKQYRDSNKEKQAEYHKQWRLANKEKLAEYQKQWRLDNPDKAKAIVKKFDSKPSTKIKKLEYYHQHKNKLL